MNNPIISSIIILLQHTDIMYPASRGLFRIPERQRGRGGGAPRVRTCNGAGATHCLHPDRRHHPATEVLLRRVM